MRTLFPFYVELTFPIIQESSAVDEAMTPILDLSSLNLDIDLIYLSIRLCI